MKFNSFEYLFLFLPIVLLIYFGLNKFKLYKISKIFLLIASLYFYGSYKWDYVYIIIVSILFNYFISYIFKKDIKKFYKKLTIIVGVCGNIIILLFFKYFNICIETLKDFNITNFDTAKIIVPLGISFFIIQQISYIVDCYRENIKEYNLIDYSLFVCFFPQLIAGPIVRHQEMIPQFNKLKNKVFNNKNILIGLFLITIGLLKKTVFADGYASFLEHMTYNKVYYNFYVSWFIGIANLFRGYFDFSGYCDLAIGSAYMFNIKLPWNFNSPFKAQSITDFWNRWNMTLIRFLKDYVYKPLSGYTKSSVNTIIIYTLMGIWLGFNSLSFLYGLINGVAIVLNELWDKLKVKLPNFIGQTLTFLFVVVSTQILVVNNFSEFKTLIKSMFGINNSNCIIYIQDLDIIFMPQSPVGVKININLLLFSFILLFFCKNSMQLAKSYLKSNNLFYTFLLAILFIIAIQSITRTSEFIYFNF